MGVGAAKVGLEPAGPTQLRHVEWSERSELCRQVGLGGWRAQGLWTLRCTDLNPSLRPPWHWQRTPRSHVPRLPLPLPLLMLMLMLMLMLG